MKARLILNRVIKPGDTIGIVGGGQLGQMMAMSAKEMGLRVGVLDPVEGCPASQVSDWFYQASYDDSVSMVAFANKCDVLTYEFENIPASVLEQQACFDKLPQGVDVLKISQNRRLEKECLRRNGLTVADYCPVYTKKELEEAIELIGYPSVLKTTEGGYDGKGQCVLKEKLNLKEALELVSHYPCVLEKWIPFKQEVSILVTGNGKGEYECFPLAENTHHHNILHQTVVPARVSKQCQIKAQDIGLTIAKALSIVGTLAIELFVTEEDDLIVNELAPRPHNSGHYTIEACQFSQFDMHIRGICGWSLPSVHLLSNAVMLNLIGEEYSKSFDYLTQKKDWSFHYYGKSELKKGRKMGHITILSNSVKNTIQEARQTTIWN